MKSGKLINPKSLFTGILLGGLISLGIISCKKQDINAEMNGKNPQYTGGGGEVPADPPCGGVKEAVGTFEILPAEYYPTYDLAIHVSSPGIYVGLPCHCHTSYIQIILNLDVADLELLASTSEPGPSPTIHVIYDSDPFGGGTGKTTGYSFNLEPGDGNIILIRFAEGYIPSNFAIETVVNSVKGICMVDNIHDPKHGN